MSINRESVKETKSLGFLSSLGYLGDLDQIIISALFPQLLNEGFGLGVISSVSSRCESLKFYLKMTEVIIDIFISLFQSEIFLQKFRLSMLL